MESCGLLDCSYSVDGTIRLALCHPLEGPGRPILDCDRSSCGFLDRLRSCETCVLEGMSRNMVEGRTTGSSSAAFSRSGRSDWSILAFQPSTSMWTRFSASLCQIGFASRTYIPAHNAKSCNVVGPNAPRYLTSSSLSAFSTGMSFQFGIHLSALT